MVKNGFFIFVPPFNTQCFNETKYVKTWDMLCILDLVSKNLKFCEMYNTTKLNINGVVYTDENPIFSFSETL